MRSTTLAAFFFGTVCLLILVACGGGGGGGGTGSVGSTPATYTISGTVTLPNGVGADHVTLTITGAGVSTTTSASTDASGKYTSPRLQNGTYTVVPSLAGYTFTPASLTVTVADGAAVADFTAVPPYSVSGKVQAANGAGLAGATVTVTKAGGSSVAAVSDGAGNYLITGLSGGDYTVTVSHPDNYVFDPPTGQSVTVGAVGTVLDFRAPQLSATYTISGKVVQQDGTGRANVPLVLTMGWTDATISTVTDNNGGFTFSGLPADDYRINPGPVGNYQFSPDPLTLTLSTGDLSGQTITIYPPGTGSAGGTPSAGS